MPFSAIKKYLSNVITNMGICDNRHGQVDQETQSPLLNIFKEIMTKEKDDPEKRNLLNEQREEKKRRQYSEKSKNKSERRSIECSSSEHRKRAPHPYKISSTEQRSEFHNKARSQSMPYQTEKKDSWWFWNTPPRKPDDTCSCVSCALKKIVSSEYACISCLLLLFTISIIVAFLVVFKNVPSGDCKVLECKECKDPPPDTGFTTPKCKDCGVADSERLKRKIEMLNSKRLRKGFVGVDEFQKNDKQEYNDVIPGQGMAGFAGIDFGPSFRELNSVDESENKLADLPNVIDSDKKLEDIQGSDKLREFYKKLIQTDAQIKLLKKKQAEVPYEEENIQISPERSRRSLKLYHYPKRYRVLRHRRSLFEKHPKSYDTNAGNLTKTKAGNKTRLKRSGNESDEPTGFIIEKKKLLVQYNSGDKKRVHPVKKCQHAPAGTHTHEKQMMHPFYKNTQRLDLLLDKFMNKNLPEIISDPFGVDDFFKHDNLRKTCKHPKPHKNVNIIGDGPLIDQIPKPKFKYKGKKDKLRKMKEDKIDESLIGQSKSDLFNMLTPESTTQFGKDFYNHEAKMIGNEKKKIVTSSPNDFEVLLSVSTIMNPDMQKLSKTPSFDFKSEKPKIRLIDRVPTLRRLMQIETGEEEDNLGYEDFKEVLTDDMDNHDEMEMSGDRKRRENEEPAQPFKIPKLNPPQGVHNPNWKGAMPLYQDELNTIINNKELPSKPTQEIQELLAAEQRHGRDLSDVEYVEEYLENKYDKLVQQAQAYSDYGVLDGKKESRNEKDSPTADTVTNHKIKLLAEESFRKPGLFARIKRAQTGSNFKDLSAITGGSEGIRIEFCPASKVNDKKIDIMKIVSQHVKCVSNAIMTNKPVTFPSMINSNYVHSSVGTTYPNIVSTFNIKTAEVTTEPTPTKEGNEDLDEKEMLLAKTAGNRRLLSTSFESSSDFRDNKDSFGHRGSNHEHNRSSIDRFVDRLHLKKNFNSTMNEKVVKSYIEEVTKVNINMFSSPTPYDSGDLISELYDSITEDSQSLDPMHASNFEAAFPPNTLVTINKSSIKFDNGDNFFGKILLSVEDPVFGMQNFNLIFDVPLLINLKEELMMMNDNQKYPSVSNQFDVYTDFTTDPQVTDIEAYPDFVVNKTASKRSKRDANVIAPSSNDEVTAENAVKSANVAETPEYKVTESITEAIIGTSSYNSSQSKSTSTPRIAINSISTEGINNSGSKLSMNASTAIADNMTLSDFFSAVANWFTALEYGKEVKPRSGSGTVLTDMLQILNSNISSDSNISSTEYSYPMYDSDMIENIGHRSRVLLSVDDHIANVTRSPEMVNNLNLTKGTASSSVDSNVFNNTTSKSPITVLRQNITTTKMNLSEQTFSTPKRDSKQKVVKRNADDSNLIFWNDIYDDEYGVQSDKMDKLDSAIRDKYSVKEKDFLKRSGTWVQNKLRKFAKNLKFNPHSDDAAVVSPSVHADGSETKERVPRSIPHKANKRWANQEMHDRVNDHTERIETEERDEIEEDYPDIDQKSLFAALSANMKEVCKKAAKAVQQTRNMDHLPDSLKRNGVQDEAKQGSITNALMQQLVRLLTELVDYQVQQKTCKKLPEELQTFLEWLTYTKEESDEPDSQSEHLFKVANQDDEELIEQLQDSQEDKAELPDEMRLTDKEELPDDRSRYLENLHSVQSLLRQYDEMSDDDKSKMTGVKGYLEKQLDMLNRQLSASDLYNFFEKRGDTDRKRRDIIITKQLTTKHRLRRNPNRHKFMKNFGKKHTRTTAGYVKANQVSDNIINRKTNEDEEIMHSDTNENSHQKLTKRNLKDVYYKAVAEAKKYSTAKSIQKKDDSSRFETSTAMRPT